jgi:hypothetical protein
MEIKSNVNFYSAQQKVLEGITNDKTKHHVLVSSRQVGKTLIALNLLLKWALESKDQYCLLVSPIFSQSKKAFLELAKACGPNNPLVVSSNASELMLTFRNGSVIRMVSGETDQNLRGITLTHLIVDEAAYIRETLWTEVLRPACMIRGKKVLFISTPRSKNWFYNIYEMGMSTDHPDWKSYRITSEENPYLNKEELDSARKSLPAEIFAAEYMGVFTESGSGVFQSFGHCVNLDYLKTGPQQNKRYFAGVDLAIANDYTVVTIMDSEGNLVDWFRENKTSWEQIIDQVKEKLKIWNATAYVELNSIGSVVYEQLRKSLGAKVKGFTTTQQSKNDIIENLKLSFEDNLVSLPPEHIWPELHLELSTFTYKVLPSGKLSYSAPSGMHDDITMSLALCNQAYSESKRKSVYFMGG